MFHPEIDTKDFAKDNWFDGRPTRIQAKEAVRMLICWAGDDPDREGLRETPERVVQAFEEYFAGYAQDPADNREIFYTIEKAKVLNEQWRRHYNTVRPHSALGCRSPATEAILILSSRLAYSPVRQPPEAPKTRPVLS